MATLSFFSSYFSRLDRRKTIYIALTVLVAILAVWAIVRLKASADVVRSARPKILPIDKKNYSVNDKVRLSVYINDQDEKDMDKVQLLVDWGDGSPVQDQAVSHFENLTELSGTPLAKVVASHFYNKAGSYSITITAKDTTGTQSLPFVIPVRVFNERDTGSTNYPPTISDLTDATVAVPKKEFNYWVEFFDYSNISLNQAKITIDWGDGSEQSVSQDIQTSREYHPDKTDYKQAIFKKTYQEEGAYVVTVTVTDGEGESTQDQAIIIASNAVVNPYLGINRMVSEIIAGGNYAFEYQILDKNGSDFIESFVEWGDGEKSDLPTTDITPTDQYRSFYQYDRKPGYFNLKNTRLQNIAHQYKKAGDYSVKVYIKDSEGGESINIMSVKVLPTIGLEFEDKFFSPKKSTDPNRPYDWEIADPWYVVGENYQSYLKKTDYWQYNPLFRWELYNSLNNKDGYAYISTDRDSNFSTLLRDLSKDFNPQEASLVSEFDFIIGGANNQGMFSFGFINNKETAAKNAATTMVVYDKDTFKVFTAAYYDQNAYTKENTSITQTKLSEPLMRNVVYRGIIKLENGSLTTQIFNKNVGQQKLIGESTVNIDKSKTTKPYNAWGVINYSDGLDVKMNPLYPSWNGIMWGYLDNVIVSDHNSETPSPAIIEQATSMAENKSFTPENVTQAEDQRIEEVTQQNPTAGQFLKEQKQKQNIVNNAQIKVEQLQQEVAQTTDNSTKNKVEQELKLANKQLVEVQEEAVVLTEGEKGIWARVSSWFISLWNGVMGIFN